MVQLMYETAADSSDVVTWEKRTHLVWREGFRGVDFDRGKTGQPAWIPLSEGLLKEIDENGSFYLVVDPLGLPYDHVRDEARYRGHLITLQEQVVKAGGTKLIFDHLRHSAATEAEESGVETDKVRHLTAHKDSAMNRQVYMQHSAKIALEIQQRRGLILNKVATEAERESDG
jgi:integrase